MRWRRWLTRLAAGFSFECGLSFLLSSHQKAQCPWRERHKHPFVSKEMHCFAPQGWKDEEKKIQEQQWPQAFSLNIQRNNQKRKKESHFSSYKLSRVCIQKQPRKVLMLCQGLVYNAKIFPWTAALPVLVLFGSVRRYSHLLLSNYSASGTAGWTEGCLCAFCLSTACCCFLWLHHGRTLTFSFSGSWFCPPTGNCQRVIRVSLLSHFTKFYENISASTLDV